MSDLLEQAATWLDGQRQTHLTRTVTYRRGSLSVELSATIGSTAFRIDDFTAGAAIVSVSRDYLIRTDALVLNGELVLPRRGDRIEEVEGGTTHVHEVMSPGGEPEWRYSDPFRKTLRIHTKETGVTTS